MKVGNTINGLTITDVKRVNKLNLIQFLKEVDSYLQQGYRLDVNSARQVGLVLQTDLYKVEQPFGYGVGSTDVGSVGEQTPTEDVLSKEAESVSDSSDVAETTESQEQSTAETSVEPVEDAAKEEAPKKTTTRSKKTAQ